MHRIIYVMLKIMLNLLIEVSVLTVPRVSTEYIQTKKESLAELHAFTRDSYILYYLQATPIVA